MAHPTLKEVVAEINWQNELFGGDPIEFPLAALDCEIIAKHIDSRMSPENLFMDGERSYAEADRIRNWLQAGMNQLGRYCAAREMAIPKTYEVTAHI